MTGLATTAAATADVAEGVELTTDKIHMLRATCATDAASTTAPGPTTWSVPGREPERRTSTRPGPEPRCGRRRRCA